MALSYKDDDEQDERLNPGSDDARRLRQQEQAAASDQTSGDNNTETAGGNSQENSDAVKTKNIDNTKEQEQEGGNWKNNFSGNTPKKQPFSLKALVKKKGPVGLILTLVLGGGGLSFFGLSLLPINLAEMFTNDTNDANASSQRKTINLLGSKLGGNLQKKLSVCNAVVSIRCKFNTLDESTAKKFKDKGFTFGEETPNGKRVGFTSMKFPDGTIVNNITDLNNVLRNNPVAASAFNAVYSLKNGLFLSKFFDGILSKLNLSKAKKISGDSKEQADKSYDDTLKGTKGTDLSTAPVADDTKNATQAEKDAAAAGNETSQTINGAIKKGTKLKTLSLKVTNALAIPQLACLTYNMSSLISTSAKVIKAARYATFAMIFLTAAASIKASKASGAEVEKATSILAPSSYPDKVEDPSTGQMIDNPNKGKNALDSEAYKVVAYGDNINLSSIAKRFFVAGGFLGVLDSIVSWMNTHIGKSAIKTTCKIANSKIASVLSFLAAPVFSIALIALTSILPIDRWAAELVNLAIDAAAGADLTTGITGVDAGNVIFIGTAAIMGTAAMKFGLKPGKLDAIRKNIANNNNAEAEQVAIEKYDARKTPFDISNRYSFFGSMAYQFSAIPSVSSQPFLSSMSKLFTALPSSMSGLVKNASAAYSMPVANYGDKRFNQCQDESYKELGIQPDMFCVVRYVPFNPVDTNVALDYMLSHNQIDDSGAPVPESNFDKYTKYCVNRDDPLGSTSVAAEEQTDDPDWYTGKKCLEDTVDNQMFSEFNGYHITQEAMDAIPPSTAQTPLDPSLGAAIVAKVTK